MMNIPRRDVQILRDLAHRVAELAPRDVNREKASLWSRLTDLDTSVRPLLLTHPWPLAWSQILPDETTLVCQDQDARHYERELRQRIWTVGTLNDDTVIEPVVHYPHCVTIEPYGGLSVKKVYAQDDHAQTGAATFVPQIHQKSDIERLGDPIVRVDTEKRKNHRLEAEEIFGAILDVIPEGICLAAKVIGEWVQLRGME